MVVSDFIKSISNNGICVISLDRPEKKNAITLQMYQQIADAITVAIGDKSTKVIILDSENEHFTSGNDLSDFLKNPSMDEDSSVYQFLQALITCPLPIISAVEGYAIGIGSTMLLHCEQVIASQSATFAFPFINLGLVPEAGSSLLLPRLVGYQKAADWLLTGDTISAQDAYEAGFVSRLVAEGEASEVAMAYAKKLCEKPRETLVEIKRLLRRNEEALQQRVEIELELFVQCLNSEPAKEAMTAFIEKRKPNF